MRSWKCLTLLAAILSFCGCAKNTPSAGEKASAVPHETPADSSENTPFTEEESPDFDPKMTLDWPGAPQESRQRIDAGSAHETTIYRATFSQTGPIVMFEANVSLMSEKDLQASDPKELLASQGTWDEHQELISEQIEFGPNKYLGFEVTGKVGDTFVRRLNVLAGRRLYALEVVSFKPERLNAEDVTNFFESFAVQE